MKTTSIYEKKAYRAHVNEMAALEAEIKKMEDGAPHKNDLIRKWQEMEKDRVEYIRYMQEVE